MSESQTNPSGAERSEERILDPSNLEAERHSVMLAFEDLLATDDDQAIQDLATELSPGDLSEILRPLSVGDTTRILRLLPPDPLAEVLSEIDNRSLSTLFTLLDNDEIADIIEEMPSDEATDLIAELDPGQAEEILAAMEQEEREEVTELLQHSPESAGGLMGKEFITCTETDTCGETVALLRVMDEDDLEETHFVFVVDGRARLVGQIPLFRLLIAEPGAPAREVMETDPLYVEVELDQEEVAGFFQTHDLISVPVVDHQMKLVGRITADDVMDVMEEEATEDISRLAGVSVQEFGEQSSFRVARSRLPWLLGALIGQVGAVMVIAVFYTEKIRWSALAVAGVFFAAGFVLRKLRIRRIGFAMILITAFWAAIFVSGIHATVAGILAAMLVPMTTAVRSGSSASSPVDATACAAAAIAYWANRSVPATTRSSR